MPSRKQIVDYLERRIRPVAIPGLTWVFILGQLVVYVLDQQGGRVLEVPGYGEVRLNDLRFVLVGELVLDGEWHRLFTWVFTGGQTRLLWFLLKLFFIFQIGQTLENVWGVAKYCLYLLIGFVVTVAYAMVFRYVPIDGSFFYLSLLIAFGTKLADVQIPLLGVFPIEARIFGLLGVLYAAIQMLRGPQEITLYVGASLANYVLFFGSDARMLVPGARSLSKPPGRKMTTSTRPVDACFICGVTADEPDVDIRYCSGCNSERCYCEKHLRDHDHWTSDDEE